MTSPRRELGRLTRPQAQLLRALPDSPSDGRRVKGSKYRVAANLRDRGFACCVGLNAITGSHYFVRTEAGEALITAHDGLLRRLEREGRR
jgi:hypothetical protein